MYRNKKDVDKHVDSLLHKLTPKDFKTRAYSIARLYYEVGDYGNCQKYVEQYLTQKSNNAAAYKLLGQALQKLGDKEKALDQFKISLDIDPSQTSTILDVCELLADEKVAMEIGRAKYWCEKAEATFPKHPITFRLKERLVTEANPDPEAFENLLRTELTARPKDALLHAKLLKCYLQTNKLKEAIDHSSDIEFTKNYFNKNLAWYETLSEILKFNALSSTDWQYQLLLLTVKERLCMLSLTDIPSGLSKNLIECNELLHSYDQAIECVLRAGAAPGFGEFHASLLQHHRGQLAFHAATYILKKAKKDQLNWYNAVTYSSPLMLIAWQTIPVSPNSNWLAHAPEKQQKAAQQWYLEGSYRCSQSGHYLLLNNQEKSQLFLDQISQVCSDTHWRDKLYEKIFVSRENLTKIESSHIASNAFIAPAIRLPRRVEVQAYDDNAQRVYPNSLHHFVWIVSNYTNFADFKCTLFDMLPSSLANCGPETLNKLDVLAFLYCATLTMRNQKKREENYGFKDKPILLPANITNLLCTLPQIKFWDCAYKLSQNELGSEYTDIRSTISRGIEIVRCIDNHGLDPELLCHLGKIFSDKATMTTEIEEKNNLETRACLYYSSAINLLEMIKCKISIKTPERRMFDYTHTEFETKQLNKLLEESKIYVALSHLNDGEYEKVVELLANLKSPEALYYLGKTYKEIALEEKRLTNNPDFHAKFLTMLEKSRQLALKSLHKIKQTDSYLKNHLYTDIQELIEDIETHLNKVETDIQMPITDNVSKYSSDENISGYSDVPATRTNNILRNISSTPIRTKPSVMNSTNYRTAIDSNVFEHTQVDLHFAESIQKDIKKLQMKDEAINNFMEQSKEWFEENRKLGNQIISTINSNISSINSNIENTTQQFKLLKISVDQVKEQIDECRNECKDVVDLKKQIAELKKEVNKLKKTSEQTIDESDLYNLEDEYRTNDNSTNFGAQLPFTTQQVMPPFAQRLVPPFAVSSNPYQLYGQNFYNLYNQYTQFPPPPAVPGAQPIFDPTRTQINYPGVYPNPDQMYLDVAHLVPPTIPAVPPVQTISSNMTSLPKVPPASSISTPKNSQAVEFKETSKSLPINVVMTSSDPLPAYTSAPAPVLSVTIPSKHIKGIPHNYQIAMPSTTDSQTVKPPLYTFPPPVTQSIASTVVPSWNQNSVFVTSQAKNTICSNDAQKSLDNSISVVDGIFSASSPNISLNKSRTLSERSNTSVENYDPCPDFKPIVPLPAEIKVTTGEENEIAIFSARAKLFRFVDKQWKERGIGEMKLLKHKITGKVRVLMRREQVHKICANHIILPEMEIKPMKNETKAYFWVANDFAEETVILEKFCIRFKTADIAKDFFEAFEKSRLESTKQSPSIVTVIAKPDTKNENVVQTPLDIKTTDKQTNKTVIGGFTFNTTPTFKSVTDSDENQTNLTVNPPTKTENVFSGLTFKTTNSSLQNVFNFKPNNTGDNSDVAKNSNNEKLNTSSELVEEFVPTAEFKPVVPLPALIDQKTGEEDEVVLFEHRAKLLRFDTASKEWKERGLGNIKILVHKDNNNKVRLLMRREQIMKICCNHALTKDMSFQKMPNMDKAVTWCAKDFSEGELVSETFCLRFKTVQSCNDFMEAIKNAQIKIGDGAKAAKEEQNAAKLIASTKECSKLDESANASNKPTNNWGDKFKPTPGSWECNNCLIRNEASCDSCNACNSPKNKDISKKIEEKTKVLGNTQPKFNFGVPKPVTAGESPASGVMSNWGDQFKPKQGTWECNQCLVRNEANAKNCSACNYPRYENKTEKKTDSCTINTAEPKFSFGIPQNLSNQTNTTPQASMFSMNKTTEKFKFGIPQTNPVNEVATDKSSNVFNISTPITNMPLDLGVDKREDLPKNFTTTKPPLLPTPKTVHAFGGNESGTFDFSFTPKPTSKGKSPVKTPKNDKGDESEDNEYASEDEGHHIHFSPVIPMPDKIEVVTGEENEEELYGHRAKLYRFTSGEWKERGIGVIKILKHRNTGKLRVVMRREQVLKICLNHALTTDVMYKPKDEKTWLFVANDFSEGELILQNFCIRFNNKDTALQFKEAIDNALKGNVDTKVNKDVDEVVFISEIQATTEEKQKAKDLMLPENFYTYKNKNPCQGCRGCNDDSDTKSDENKTVLSKNTSTKQNVFVCTPDKSTASAFLSPTTSIYSTPNHSEKNADTSLFRTPLSTMGSQSKTSISINETFIANESQNKENTLTETPSLHTSTEPVSFISPSQTPTRNKGSILATPKLAVLEKAASVEPTTTSGSAEVNSVFGINKSEDKKPTSSEKPVFGGIKSVFGENKSGIGESNLTIGENKPKFRENKSIFGENKPVFGENKSIFGENKSVFGENKSVFGENKSVFGENKSVFGENKSVFGENKSIFGENKPAFSENKSIFHDKSSFGENKSAFGGSKLPVFGDVKSELHGENKSVFGVNKPVFGESKSIFGENKSIFGENKSIFGENKSVFGENKSIFGETKPVFGEINSTFGIKKPIFGENKPAFEKSAVFGDIKPTFGTGVSSNQSIFAFNKPTGNDPESFNSSTTSLVTSTSSSSKQDETNPTRSIWATPFAFGGFTQNQDTTSSLFSGIQSNTSNTLFSNKTGEVDKSVIETKVTEVKPIETKAEAEPIFKVDESLSFTTLSSNNKGFETQKNTDFKWEGAGQPLFTNAQADAADKSKANISAGESATDAGADEEYDPHYEPIVPLPDKIVVTTGEEDEEKMFGERCKLYRFDEKSREWKERGVGEMKILYHPERKSYRMLLRREQVYKAVLNMLIFPDLELLPMKNSDRAWTWAGRNYAESTGEQETLAVRFKSVALATAFYDKIQECVKKLQAAVEEINESQVKPGAPIAQLRQPKHMQANAQAEESPVAPLRLPKHMQARAQVEESPVAPLRLPKHLQANSRVDETIAATVNQTVQSPSTHEERTVTESTDTTQPQSPLHQVYFETHEEDQEYDNEHDDYEHEYDEHNEDDSDGYYNEEEDEVYYLGKAVIKQGDIETTCEESQIEVTIDHDICLPKIVITDSNTGDILADMVLQTDTEFQMTENSCSWSGSDYTSNNPIPKSVTVTFSDSNTAVEFYDAFETSKAAVYHDYHKS